MVCSLWLLSAGVLAVVGGVLVGGIQVWMREKSYVFTPEDLASITTDVLNETPGGGHDEVFGAVEAVLRDRYPAHILPPSQMEWIFINAGGWMGSFYLLHASLTEYVLFFGTAVDTSGHSGRYWANVSDTVISGEFRQWKEGTTESVVYVRGDTLLHQVGEAAAIQWSSGTWMVEYGRGFIPSTLGFALSETVLCTQDLYLLYRTLRIYTVALLQEMWYNGNF
ncbi:Sigma non-opioid intracellular receptor 1 [Geodia barretti]|uniref:Sigma non-opioid intracellular receptor 1 n=1 Tax=Geodia barretti TaxID=519541 RepID=A0AA35WFV1_GEOBA|nr:Sigma non-opioid intracellular receptor 1 [Geodia barretti]